MTTRIRLRHWLWTVALAAGLCVASAPVGAAGLVSMTDAFPEFHDATATLSDKDRLDRFHAEFGKLFPAYYAPRNRTPERYDEIILKALHDFPDIRARYAIVSRDFPRDFAEGQKSFRKTFPDYRLNIPVYLLHSLGEMDGGTRELDGKTVGIFGADVIAKVHGTGSLKPFLDHEVFHFYHQRFFPGCDQLWCNLWTEGLAVYVATKLNPGATDEELLLTQPQPIRPAVAPRLKEAMCGLRAKLNSTSEDDYAPFFFGRPSTGPFPPRYGYLLGLLLVEKIGATMTLEQLAKMPPAKVEPALEAALAAYGPCP
jgi:hypothetical protein